MINAVEHTVKKYRLINSGDKIIVALSGGADSVTLLDILVSLKEKYDLTIYAAHINHNLRGAEANRDEAFCKSLCKKYGVELFVKSVDVKALAKQQKISEELCGRNVRYDFFDELSKTLGAKTATAHTASDNAETLIFNIARGTSVGGTGAIPPSRGNIIRPLIELCRADIESYCTVNGLDYVTDSTNLGDDYTRNNIRHNVIPVLKSINPAFETAALRLSENAREAEAYLNGVAQNALISCKTDYGYDCKKLSALDIAVRKQLLIILCKNNNIKPEYKHILLLCDIIENGGSLELSKNCTAISKQGILRLINSNNNNGCLSDMHLAPVRLDKSTEFDFNGNHYSVTELNCYTNEKNTVKLSDDLMQRAVFRTRRSGDSFTYPVRKLKKPLRKVLNEQKIPSELRDNLIVLACDSVILWCESIGASLQAVSSDGNNILKISVNSGE